MKNRFLLILVALFLSLLLTGCDDRVYDMSGVTFEDQTHVYDGNIKSLKISGNLPDGVSVSYKNNNQTNVGTYTITAEFTGSPKYQKILDMTATLTITKATYDMSAVSFVDASFNYDGTAKSLQISGNLPEGVTVSYENNNQTNAGSYEVKAKFAGNNNYHDIPSLTATLTINKLTYDMSAVSLEDASFDYDGTTKSLKINGTLPEGVTVSYENNQQTNAGIYEVKANFSGHEHYQEIPSLTATLTINKLTYDMSGISFENASFDYDGTAKSLMISGTLPEGVAVTYENNNQTDVGRYEVKANFIGNQNYHNIDPMTATLTIKARVEASLPDLSGKNQEDITSALNALGFNNVKINEVFNVRIFKGRFIGYQDYEIGEIAKFSDEIEVNISTRNLPNIAGFLVTEIKQFFLDAGVSANNIVAVPSLTGDPDYVLGYYEREVGEEYVTGAIMYLQNMASVKLKDLTGYTVPQINKYLKDNEITADFYEMVNNAKEMDTFSRYVGYSIGQIVPKGTKISIIIHTNDDLNDEKQLFISKSVEDSPGNNGLELYNPLDTAIDLSDYYLSIFENGSIYETYWVDLAGTLAANETYFIVSSTSSDVLKEKAYLISSNLIFDGNDTIQLRKKSNNTYIDTIFNIGNNEPRFSDEIFIRRQNITKGNRNFDMREWAGYIPSFIEVINNHPYEILDHPTFELIDEIFPNYGMTKVRYKSAADGDTVYFESLDPRDLGPYDGNSRLRFLMVDTPETEKPGVTGEPYAQVASDFTKNALSKASEIYIQADRSAGIKDNYGRNLGVVWYNAGTVANPDWRLLNFELIYNGLGDHSGTKISLENIKNQMFGVIAICINGFKMQWFTLKLIN